MKQIDKDQATDMQTIAMKAGLAKENEKIKEKAREAREYFNNLPECSCEDYKKLMKIIFPYLRPSPQMIHLLGKAELYETFRNIEKEMEK